MTTTFEITNKKLFDAKVIDVHTDCMTYFHGTLGIELEGEDEKIITGEHGPNDYENEFGFVLKLNE